MNADDTIRDAWYRVLLNPITGSKIGDESAQDRHEVNYVIDKLIAAFIAAAPQQTSTSPSGHCMKGNGDRNRLGEAKAAPQDQP